MAQRPDSRTMQYDPRAVLFSRTASYGKEHTYPATLDSRNVTMPDMPAFPDDDLPLTPRSDHHRPVEQHRRAGSGGAVPYPTTSFFPDPNHFDITGMGVPTTETHGPTSKQVLVPLTERGASTITNQPYETEIQPPNQHARVPSEHFSSKNASKEVVHEVKSQPPSVTAFAADHHRSPSFLARQVETLTFREKSGGTAASAAPRRPEVASSYHVLDYEPAKPRSEPRNNDSYLHHDGPQKHRHIISQDQSVTRTWSREGDLSSSDAHSEIHIIDYNHTGRGHDSSRHKSGHERHSGDDRSSHHAKTHHHRTHHGHHKSLSDQRHSDAHSDSSHGTHRKKHHSSPEHKYQENHSRTASHDVGFRHQHVQDHESSPTQKRALVYDPTPDAARLYKALAHSHVSNISISTIIKVLPHLTHDQILLLATTYSHVSSGSHHISLASDLHRLHGQLGRATYSVALGRHGADAYFVSHHHMHGHAVREVFAETLLGRTNADIKAIKAAYKEKKYDDDLSVMAAHKLKEDKFQTAVLWALEAKRQEETEALDHIHVEKDAATLRTCLKDGSDNRLLEIVIKRSDHHLHAVLKEYDIKYGSNFAREALAQCSSTVGEIVAHILNGVINRPARDALLLRHAISEAKHGRKDDSLELLVGRLVRLHWDAKHLTKVKKEYKTKTGHNLEHDVAAVTTDDLSLFLQALCTSHS